MAKLFDVIEVREHSGAWTRGNYPMEFYDRAFETGIVDICAPAYPLAQKPDVDFGSDAVPFAIIGTAKTPTRCEPEEFDAIALDTMTRSTEHMVSDLLWHGSDAVDFAEFIEHPDIETVTRESTYPATVAKVLSAAYEQTPWFNPVLHLGFEAAIALGISLRNLTVPFVVGSAYPTNAVAVTDLALVVNLSPIEQTSAVQIDVNRKQIELTRFASFEFDSYRAVRAA
jgi:hypothetical protein